MKQPTYKFRYWSKSGNGFFETYAGLAPTNNKLQLSAVPMALIGRDKFRSVIYAGDLVKWQSGMLGEQVGLVIDCEIQGRCIVVYQKWYDRHNEAGTGLTYHNLVDWSRCEIVGNVFDTPEAIPAGLHNLAGHYTEGIK